MTQSGLTFEKRSHYLNEKNRIQLNTLFIKIVEEVGQIVSFMKDRKQFNFFFSFTGDGELFLEEFFIYPHLENQFLLQPLKTALENSRIEAARKPTLEAAKNSNKSSSNRRAGL